MARMLCGLSAAIAVLLGTAAAPPTVTVTLGGRTACVSPKTRGQARADGGIIDVVAASNSVTATLTGTAAANAFLGSTGSASETFHLVQEFEVACSDSAVKTVDVSLDSALLGFVRARHKAGACMIKACAEVSPLDNPMGVPALVISHPALCVEGTDGRLCNQHLPPVKATGLPLGRYLLVADFVITAEGGGVCDGHGVADFSPSTSLPADWVRLRDPFQGVEKKNFGFNLTVTAEPVSAGASTASKSVASGVVRASMKVGNSPIATPAGTNADLLGDSHLATSSNSLPKKRPMFGPGNK